VIPNRDPGALRASADLLRIRVGPKARGAHTQGVSWLQAALKVAEMHSAGVCSRCGEVVPAGAGWCGRCELPRGVSAAYESARAEPGYPRQLPWGSSSPTATQPPPAATTSAASDQRCAACGARLADGAYWCSKCGQSRVAFAVAPVTPVAPSGRVGPTPRSHVLSRSALAGIGASLAAAVLVLAAIGGNSGTTGSGALPSGPATTMLIGAAGVSGSVSVLAPTSESAASAGSSIPTVPPASSAKPAITEPPSASATPVRATATPTLAETPSDSTALALDITGLPASVASNATVTLVVVTSPGATCDVKVKYHSGKLSLAPGLAKKQVADSAGIVSWTWIVESGTEAGNATATVTCKLKGNSSSKSKVFVVI
jgi:ribosomal protein L40E